MAVVQEAFFIPDDLNTKLLSGELVRLGGVLRHAKGPEKGQIVKHLDPVDLQNANEDTGLIEKVVETVRENKKWFIIGGAVFVVVEGGRYIYYRIKTSEPKVMVKFRKALNEYLNAIRTGDLNMKTINNMADAIQNLKSHKKYERFRIELSINEIESLVKTIQDYTNQLAFNNSVDIPDLEADKDTDAIINLEKYLDIQKRVFQEAA